MMADDEGVVQPPSELKVVIDKTAEFVVKSGKELEQRILIAEAANPKFAFMRPGNVYFAYYQLKMRDIRRAQQPQEADQQPQQPASTAAASLPLDPLAAAQEKLELRKKFLSGGGETSDTARVSTGGGGGGATAAVLRRVGLLDALARTMSIKDAAQPSSVEPRKSWALDVPALTAADLDIIKVTAQYVARNGRSFQMGLMNREARNPQFGFLQPGHPYNPFYNKLVESYTAVLLPSRELIDQLSTMRLDKEGVLRRIVSRGLAQRLLVKTEAQRQAAEEAEREAMAQIDWTDFVIVQTISFTETEQLPPPPDKQHLIAGSLAPESDVPSQPPSRESQPTTALPVPPPPAFTDSGVMISPDDVPSAPTKIVSAGTTAATRKNLSSLNTTICPKCGQAIPVADFAEHMKIELSGAGQILHGPAGSGRKMETARGSGVDNPYEEGDMISMNLQRLAAKRTDIFGGEEDDEAESLAKKRAEEEQMRKLRESKSWDGHASTIPSASTPTGVYDQIAAIHQAKGLASAGRTPIGPQEASAAPAIIMNRGIPPTASRPGASMPSAYPAPPPMMMMMMPPPYGAQYPAPGYPASVPFPSPVSPASSATTPNQQGGLKRGPSDTPLEEEPPSKRAKIEEVLIDEAVWLDKMGGHNRILQLKITVQVPGAPSEELEVELALGQPVSALKSLLQQRTGIAPNKQNIRSGTNGIFLKDRLSLAYHNLDDNSHLILLPKERGGKKK